MAAEDYPVSTNSNLEDAMATADIVSSATMSHDPVVLGNWVKSGTHVDLIGAFKSDMREADDALLKNALIFVDSYDTTLEHIGELKIPLEIGVISRKDLCGDLNDIVSRKATRSNANQITLFKNGGGAHLDLMTAKILLEVVK